jgi:hypothetical protein
MRNVNFVETCLTGKTGFIIVPYLANSNALPSKNEFSFHCNSVKVDLICKGTYNVFNLKLRNFTKILILIEYPCSRANLFSSFLAP